MSRKFVRFSAILAILIISIGTTGVARADQAAGKMTDVSIASAGTSRWFTGWADQLTSTDVGSSPSIAYSPVDGLPYISYYDAVNHRLMLASPVASSAADNTCLHTKWYCRVVDGNGNNGSSNDAVGQYSSIAFWRGVLPTQGWKLGISYYDATTSALRLAVWSQAPLLGGNWTFTTIVAGGVFYNPGLYTSLKFRTDGKAQIAYYADDTFGNEGYLELATNVGSGGNCVGGKWQCDDIDSGAGAGVGQYASLGLGYNNVAYIAYQDGANANLKYAHFAGVNNGNCGPGNSYECIVITSSGVTGLSAALTAPRSSTDKPRIAYYDKTNGNLRYAMPTASGNGGNCGGTAWQCNTVDFIGAGIIIHVGISMTLDENGNPLIAYMNASEDQGPAVLNIARPAFTVGMPVGNCGDVPPGYLFMYWQCNTIDYAGNPDYLNVAAYTAVAVSSNGLATIAYLNDDSSDFPDQFSLKVAYQRLQVFLPLIKR